MIQDFAQAEQVIGYPPFVRRSDNAFVIYWWAPERTGNPEADYRAGAEHFKTTLKLLHELRTNCFFPKLVVREEPCIILATIVNAMQESGPIERGFIDALAGKAIAGRILTPAVEMTDDVESPWQHAITCLDAARVLGITEFVTDELVSVIDQTFDYGRPEVFIWTICAAATTGALH